MLYHIRHVTRFNYEKPVSESVMEARMQPLQDATQRCLHFGLATSPGSRVLFYEDHQGNAVHHFAIPGHHTTLTITADAVVECAPRPALPEAMDGGAWAELDTIAESGAEWEATAPSTFARPSDALVTLTVELGLDRSLDPLSLLRRVMIGMQRRFEYRPKATRVDSPIDDALTTRQGVCQDFAHIFIAVARFQGIPCRYVSGYLCHDPAAATSSTDGATHAWTEAFLPGLGWVGFDPTHNTLASAQHIRIAVERDYADVPPTRGVFKGATAVRTELSVAVDVVSAVPDQAREIVRPFAPWMSRDAAAPMAVDDDDQIARQQQQ